MTEIELEEIKYKIFEVLLEWKKDTGLEIGLSELTDLSNDIADKLEK